MDAGKLRAWLHENSAALTSTEARHIGFTPTDLQSAVRAGLLDRVCRGAYVDTAAARAADPEALHRLRLHAILRSQPQQLIASHTSGALAWGIPVSYAYLDRVHVARTQARGTTRRYVHHTLHEGYSHAASTTAAGIPAVCAAVAVLGTAFVGGVKPGLVAADAALRERMTSRDELELWMAELERTPGMAAARAAVAASSPSAESPGESLLRLILTNAGLAVIPQFTVRDAGGCFVARVDFLLPELNLVVEFDGATKYADVATGPEALFAEKRREDDIRRLGYGVVRVIWSDLSEPQRILREIRSAYGAQPRKLA
ncbi:MAG: type IV toxin-antitoxin system AbiEi family antitoxin domain-containing protein [Ornithinimicrobium sp.]